MVCSDFLSRYSDFRDDQVLPGEFEAFEAHLALCPSCARYADVLSRGLDLLKKSDAPLLPPDFRERLQHSIYSMEEEERRRRLPAGGSGAMAAAAIAAVLAAVIWTPTFWHVDPSVELPPIVAQNPNPRPAPLAIPQLSEERASSLVAFPLAGQELWEESNVLLYQHSPLYFRHRETNLVRAGLR